MNLSIKKQNFYTYLSLFIYRLSLDITYCFFISDIFTSMNFSLDFNIIKLIESYFLFFVVLFFIPKSKERIGNIMIWIIVLLTYIPMLTLYAFKNESRIFMFASSIFWLLIFILKAVPFKKIRFSYLKQRKIIYIGIFFLLFFLVGFLLFNNFKPSITFDFSNVYEIRSQYSEAGIPLVGYFFPWMAKIIIPFLLALFITKRKWLYLLPLLLIQIFLFSVTGLKNYFFIPFFCLGLVWLIRRKNPLFWMSLGLTFIIMIGIFFYLVANNVLFMSWFTRRVMFVPSLISFEYYEFFSENQPVYLSHHWPFRVFLSYPYRLGPADLIGKIYHRGGHANNGMMSDGYLNFGFIGMGIWAILYVVIFKTIDFLTYKKDQRIGICAVGALTLSLINSFLFISFLTNGLILVLFLLYLLPYNKDDNFKLK